VIAATRAAPDGIAVSGTSAQRVSRSLLADLRPRLIGDDQVAAAAVRSSRAVRWVVPPRREHLLVWLRCGSAHLSGPEVNADVGARTPMILSASESFELTISPADATFVLVSDSLLQAATERSICGSNGFLFGQVRPSVNTSALVRDFARIISAAVTTGPDRCEDRASARQRLASAVLSAFPQRRPAGRSVSRLESALRFVMEHARDPVTVADIAAAGSISCRGLQQQFSRELQTTPLRFLRAVRLDGTRADLLTAAPGTTVAEIARAWQIHHLGRFSGEYYQRFGELPSDTLRKRTTRTSAGSAAFNRDAGTRR
jgi:AraC-like DNA-binding protein